MLKERPEFYKEEIRCGYTVDEKTKRVWAVQLEMLDEVERICKANGLKYFADSGTLIGTIRHEGYIRSIRADRPGLVERRSGSSDCVYRKKLSQRACTDTQQ